MLYCLQEVAGVQFGHKGVIVNECLQSVSNPKVYAAGDAAASGNPPLTPSAEHEGKIATSNLLNGNHKISDTKGAIPSIVFTIPPMASVGLQEEAAKVSNLERIMKKIHRAGILLIELVKISLHLKCLLRRAAIVF